MKDLLFSVMAVSLFSAAVHILAPEGKGGLAKTIRFAAALAVCAALMSPMLSVLGKELMNFSLSLPAISDIDTASAEEAILSIGTESLCRELEARAVSRFALEEAHLSLTLDSSDVSSVRILGGVLRGRGELKEAATYLGELLGCEIQTEEG